MLTLHLQPCFVNEVADLISANCSGSNDFNCSFTVMCHSAALIQTAYGRQTSAGKSDINMDKDTVAVPHLHMPKGAMEEETLLSQKGATQHH